MLMITGHKPIKHSKQGQFQIINVVDMMGPITKYTTQIVSGDNVPFRIREAFRLAEEERPGAVHLELPEDIAAEDSSSKPLQPSLARRPTVETKSVQHALNLLEIAKSPLLVLGAGANRKLTAKQLRAFVDKYGIPFITTQMGKGVIDETHEHCVGNAALSSGDFVHRVVEHADLIINVGHDVVEKPPFFMKDSGVQVIHINFNSARVDPVYFPQVEMVGDIANSIWQLSQVLSPQPHWDFSCFAPAIQAMRDHVLEGSDDERFPIYPQRLVADVRQAMPKDAIIALDNGIYKIWFARNYPAHQPNTVLLDNALATMGAGLPSAMAAKMVFPDRKVMAICGDGGFMMNSQELETAVRLNLDLIILLLNDSAYGMIRWKQANLEFNDFGLEFSNPCFKRYAESYGAKGYRVESAAELLPLIKKCNEQPGVHLIDVPVDYTENDEVLNRQLPRRSKEI